MKLVWHIARKDLRRLALPVVAWLALLLAPTVAFGLVSPSIEGHAASSIDTWRTVFAIWMRLMEGVTLIIGFVLAGSLVLEDALVGANTFWPTRPITSARLFAAKLIAAAILFVAEPMLVLLPVWLASGFGPVDVALGAWDWAQRAGVGLLFALMVASLARSLVQFLVFALLLIGLWVSTVLLPEPFWRGVPGPLRQTRWWLVLAGMLPALAVVLTHQFLTRRTARSWGLIAAVLAMNVLVLAAWPWEFGVLGVARLPVEPTPPDGAAKVIAAPAFTQRKSNSVPSLYGKSAWAPDLFVAPVYARAADGRPVMRGGGSWEAESGLRILGFSPATTPLRWQMHLLGWRPAPDKEEPFFSGTLEVWKIRPRVLGEMRVEPGARLTHGSAQSRILQLQRDQDGRLDQIFIEERDSERGHARGWFRDWHRQIGGRERHIDRYFLVHRGLNKALAASAADFGPVKMNSLVLAFRAVGVTWPHDLAGTVLVKVRFERVSAFDLPVEVRGVTKLGWEQLP